MEVSLTLIYLVLYGVTYVGSDTHVTGIQEYCNMQEFQAECPANEVILMETATYGRMRIGECVLGNYGYLGCFIDVRSRMDTLCSGRHRCQFTVPDQQMYERRSCPGDFNSHLEASYSCVRVATGSEKECRESRKVKVVGSSGYIASIITQESSAGSVHCPWLIRVNPGQRINITVFNFIGELIEPEDGNEVRQNSRRQDNCYELIVIRELGNQRVIVICSDDSRTKTVYLSTTNEIAINIVDRRILESVGTFLLKYEALGCPALPPIENAWTAVDTEGTVKVTCNFTEETWFLTCRGSSWVGHVGNCSHRILIVVGIGIVLGIVVGGLLLSCVVVYTRSRYRNSQSQKGGDVSDDKPIIMANPSHGTPTWSRQGVPPPPPPPVPPIESMPTGDPYPNVSMLQPDVTPSHTLIRNPHAQDSGYGSSGMTPFSTFGQCTRHHIYESPTFS